MKECHKCGADDWMPSGGCRPCRRAKYLRENPPRVNLKKTFIDFDPIYHACEKLRKYYNSGNIENDQRIYWTVPKNYETMYDIGVKRGTISVLSADAFCCDVLEIHPVEIYGWEFMTYGEEEGLVIR